MKNVNDAAKAWTRAVELRSLKEPLGYLKSLATHESDGISDEAEDSDDS